MILAQMSHPVVGKILMLPELEQHHWSAVDNPNLMQYWNIPNAVNSASYDADWAEPVSHL